MSFDVSKGPLRNQPPQHVAAQRLIIQCPGRHHPRMQISVGPPIGVHVHATDTLIGLVKYGPGEALTGGEMASVPTHVLAVACQIKRTVEGWPPVPRKAPGGTNVIKRSRPRSKVGFGVLLAERLEAQKPPRGIHRRRIGNHEVGRNEGATVRSRQLLNRESFFLYVVVHQTRLSPCASMRLTRSIGNSATHPWEAFRASCQLGSTSVISRPSPNPAWVRGCRHRADPCRGTQRRAGTRSRRVR